MNTKEYTIVDENHEFTFPGYCPYCQGALTYHCEEWEQDDDGLWQAVLLLPDCDSEPDIESREWSTWFRNHSYMPYLHQLPVDTKVKEYINNNFRFKLT